MDNFSNIRISFIIPVLNGEDFIAKCLDHIIAEMGSTDSIVVVDNGSTDKTLEILKNYSTVTTLNCPDITIAAMRNRGAEKTDSDLLAFIDSDVLVCPGWRSAVLGALSDQDIKATGSICCIPDNATWIERAWWSFGRPVASRVNYINTGNLIVRRDAFEQINGFNESLISDEDTDIGTRLNNQSCWLLDDPKIKAIHLGNAKTLKAFTNKEKWHATSILDVIKSGSIDKAIIMTFLYMLLIASAILSLPLAFESPVLLLPIAGAILFVPMLTSLFRAVQYSNYRYFFYLTILYFVFYSVRSITVIEKLFAILLSKDNK